MEAFEAFNQVQTHLLALAHASVERIVLEQFLLGVAALARELYEEMGVRIVVLEQVMHTHHEYPTYDIDFRVFRCQLSDSGSEIHHLRVHDHRWVALEEMGQYRFPDADAKTLARLLDLDH
ncbi:NUDIX domain-containing protein [Corallococcus praedator]|uniref:NUDIX domain-containing protein n=1 Tax=Corallococcus praedator TaxID=2316724 RepID=UPI001FC9F8E2|nr:NUDIX domain-containing protein [Corallococcus praedator]